MNQWNQAIDAPATLPEPPAMGIVDYLDILRRRKWMMIIAAVLVMLVAAAVAALLPAMYRSQATILVEEQAVPQEFVRSTITSYADERIQVISQRVLTRSTLLQMIEKYDLYADRRDLATNDELIERMRRDIRLQPISTDSTRGGNRVVIAFNISYVSEWPRKSQQVTNELVSLFLNENVRVRQQRTAETSAFLAEEAKRLAAQLQEIEAKLASFRSRHVGALPESSPVNHAAVDRTESELMRIDRDIRIAEDRRQLLQAQLAVVPPRLPTREETLAAAPAAERVLTPAERLRQLRIQQTSLTSAYSDIHPDVRRVNREIAALEREIEANKETAGSGATTVAGSGATTVASSGAAGEAAARELAALRDKLRGARERLTEDHPDVQRLQRTIAALEASGAATPAAAAAGRGASPASAVSAATAAGKPDNPAYVGLVAAIEAAASEARELAKLRVELRSRQRLYVARLEQAPLLAREYTDLARDYDNALNKYREIKGKELEAQLAEELERNRKGERFSLIEPASFPERPFSPNRTMILMLGLVLAIGSGIGFGALRELLDFTVKGPRDLSRSIALPVLSMVPYLPNRDEHVRGARIKWIALAGLASAVVVALLVFHYFITPFSVLWFMLMRSVMGF
jgi:uncharacterized protein involved in exopolysaccharide biosynthesis